MAGEFGKYRLLRRLAVGGMAEVFLAEVRGEGGFRKFVAIKRILPHLSDEKEFISMFFDEARLMARFAHPNIVQIYDLGRVKNTYFLAMEFVKGLTMFRVVNRCAKLRQRIPLHITARIISDTCSALDYAHNFSGPDGSPLEIVHRDVSAQNVMLSTEGVVKVLDFGVAKAVGNLSRTRPSWLKGKALYMSPEQIEMRPIDRRSDIFSLGTLLYIMTTMHRPFRGESEYQVMMSIVNQPAPDPREYNPDLPEEIVRIISKALEKDIGARYQTAQQMRDDLEHFLFERRQRVEASELSQFLLSLLPARKKKTTGVKRVPTRPIPAPLASVPSIDLGNSELEEISADQPILLVPKTRAEPVLLNRPKTPIREVPQEPATEPAPAAQPGSSPKKAATPVTGTAPSLEVPFSEQEEPFSALTRPRRAPLWSAIFLLGLVLVALVVWLTWPAEPPSPAVTAVDAGTPPTQTVGQATTEPAGASGQPASQDAGLADAGLAPGTPPSGKVKVATRPLRHRQAGRPRHRRPTWQTVEPVIETLPETAAPEQGAGSKDTSGRKTQPAAGRQEAPPPEPADAGTDHPAGAPTEVSTPTAPGGRKEAAVAPPPMPPVKGGAEKLPQESAGAPSPDAGPAARQADRASVAALTPAPKTVAPAPGKLEPIYLPAARVKARLLSGHDPEYPRIARAARLQAKLVVKIYISPEGRVEKLRFLKTHEAFEAAVREAVGKWRFSPYLVKGRPVPIYTVYKFVFKLD